jgi:DNA gyrase subunit A
MVVDFALTDREEDEPEEGEESAASEETVISAETADTGSGLSANASKVQELADTLAAEIEAEDIAVSETQEDSADTDKNDGDNDI